MKSIKTASIIITTYNRAKMVERCIESVLASSYDKIEVVVVDDCSPDDTYAKLCARFSSDSRVKIIENEHNLGAAASRNAGASQSAGDYLLFLDDNNIVQPDMVSHLVSSLDNDAKLGLVGPLAVHHTLDYEDEIWTLGSDFNRWTSQPHDFKPHTKITDFHPTNEIYPTTYIPNASMVRRELFERIGGFDSSFGIMFDESDYGWRICSLGCTAGICVTARTDHYHMGGADCNAKLRQLGIEKPRRAYCFGRNRLWFAKRHFSFLQTLSVMFVFAPASALYYGLVSVKNRRFDIAKAYLFGTIVGLFTRAKGTDK